MKKAFIFSAVATLALAAAQTFAAYSLSINSAVTQVTNLNSTAGSSTTPSVINADILAGGPHDYKITFYVSLTGTPAAGEEGFGNAAMNIALTGGVVRSTLAAHANYAAASANVNDYGNPTALFDINGDKGASSTDLQDIIIDIGTGYDPNDGSADDGTGNAFLEGVGANQVAFGSIWVSQPGISAGTMSLTVPQWSTNDGDPTVLTVTNDAASGTTQSFPVSIPEPASLSLLGLGALGFARRRRA